MSSFRNLVKSTLISVYFLILVGGVVRSTGSGMGCPDWPKCFGQWVPPTSVEQLPDNYKEAYSEYRHQKNIKFAKYLSAFGLENTAKQILMDKSIREEADFNPIKTWIEYLNRIVGVIIGFLIFAVFVFSIRFWKIYRSLTILAFMSFVLVGFQGWIGSFVVSTNLTPWTITVHMFLAMVIVALLIYLLHKVTWSALGVSSNLLQVSSFVKVLLIVCMIALLTQILLGTQVREAIDRVAAEISDRQDWIAATGSSFILHRSFSWIIMLLYAVLVVKLWKTGKKYNFTLSVILLILGTVLTGVGMAWFSVPPFLQAVHLLLATVTFGVEFLLLLQVNSKMSSVLK